MNLKYKALIIEDNKSISFFNKIILDRSTFFSEVEIVENGYEALELLKTDYIPSIIFLDINMPVMDGWEFLEKYTETFNELSPILLLVGTKQSDVDKDKLNKYKNVKGVRDKMLSQELLLEIKNRILGN